MSGGIEEYAPQKAPRVVECVLDVSGIDRHFSYLVPEDLGPIGLGTLVRVPLGSRRVRAWVLREAEHATREDLRPIHSVISLGPAPDVLELVEFAVTRYAGWHRPFLSAASPPRLVRDLHSRGLSRPVAVPLPAELDRVVADALSHRVAVVRWPPSRTRLELVLSVAAAVGTERSLLVLVPEHHDAEVLTQRLRRAGHATARLPEEWASAASGGRIVVGTRNAVLARVPDLGAILVLDAHEEAYVSERAPTWNAAVLAAARAERAEISCLLASACPSLELSALGTSVALPPANERAGWPSVEVLDRRSDDPRSGLYAPALGATIRGARAADPSRPVVCVLNRTGRVRLFSCTACGELVTCEHCGGALVERRSPEPGAARELECPSCGTTRPVVCAHCGARRLRLVRIGVGRAAEELAALVGEPVTELSGASPSPERLAGVVVGTEAALHRVRRASLVVFLDFDQHLLAPRYRAGEVSLGLLARAARLLVGSARGRLVVQTRLIDAPALLAARRGEPELLATAETQRREELSLPPFAALAELSGTGAAEYADELRSTLEVSARRADRFVVRARDHATLLGALGSEQRREQVRIAVDPLDA